MTDEPTKHLRLHIIRREGTLSGDVGIEGRPSKHFTGWIALNAAIEHLLDEDEEADGDQTQSTSAPE